MNDVPHSFSDKDPLIPQEGIPANFQQEAPASPPLPPAPSHVAQLSETTIQQDALPQLPPTTPVFTKQHQILQDLVHDAQWVVQQLPTMWHRSVRWPIWSVALVVAILWIMFATLARGVGASSVDASVSIYATETPQAIPATATIAQIRYVPNATEAPIIVPPTATPVPPPIVSQPVIRSQPTALPLPRNTAVPPATATPVPPPTATPVPPPTATPVPPPTATPVPPPTATPVPPPTATPVPPPTATPVPAPTWTTIQSFSGQNMKKTEVFYVPSPWRIIWTCDPSGSFGGQFYFGVYIYKDGTLNSVAINAVCKSGNVGDSTLEYDSGNIYLSVISSGGPWTMTIQAFR